MAAVDGGDDAVDSDFALLADGHFGDLADDRVVAFMDGDAAAATGAERFAPVALYRDLVEHTDEVRPVRQQRATELVGILAGRVRQFVDIAFHEESILGGADRTPETHRDVGTLEHATNTYIGDFIVGVGDAFDRLRLEAF